ncbi:MAG TPA: CsgG/HfaB family protein [Gemmatimonadaceae bacterium]|nr:CsgG/HfaB family protein [Gemmatimonadaceae bacterium]
MKAIAYTSFSIALMLARAVVPERAAAQEPDPVTQQPSMSPTDAPTRTVPVTAAPAVPAAVVHSDKPRLMVMGFEAGTVNAQAKDKGGFFGHINKESYDPSQLGIGIADMLVEKLLATGQFRLVERKAGESGSGAQFIVSGSVTRFGFEERNFGGLAASIATMGLLSYKQSKTEVVLTARIINAATGEIVASMRSEGGSGKGGGLRVFGMGANGAGGADMSSSNFRATAIGQATERAVADLAQKIVEQKASF